jgi:hypothetical protein
MGTWHRTFPTIITVCPAAIPTGTAQPDGRNQINQSINQSTHRKNSNDDTNTANETNNVSEFSQSLTKVDLEIAVCLDGEGC